MVEIFRLYYQEMVYYATKKTRDIEVSKELVADVFIKIIINPDIDIRIQLYRNVTLKCIDYYRSTRSRNLFFKSYTPDIVIDNVESDLIEADLLKTLRYKIEQLPQEAKVVIKMYYIEGLNTNEISKVLNKPAATIRSLKQYGINKLKKQITDD